METPIMPLDADNLFKNVSDDIGLDSNKFDLYLEKIESQVNNGIIFTRTWHNNTWYTVFDFLNEKDAFINGAYDKSNRLIRLYLDYHSKTVSCENWVYHCGLIQGDIQNFQFRTSKIINFIKINDFTKNISKQLFGDYIAGWTPPASIAVKTSNNSIYFLAPLNDDVKEIEQMAIRSLEKNCELITYD
jgi:hypothetical protein